MTGETNVVLAQSIDTARGLLQRLVGPAIDQMGLLLSDKVVVWRFNNQVKNLNKVKALVDKHSISIKKVDMKVVFPYLEGVALEDDEKLQDMWANLFTNYIDTKKNLVLTVYPSILKQLSSSEVKVLEHMRDHKRKLDIAKDKAVIENHAVVLNLERLGLIRMRFEGHSIEGIVQEMSSDEYYLSPFGQEFLMACER